MQEYKGAALAFLALGGPGWGWRDRERGGRANTVRCVTVPLVTSAVDRSVRLTATGFMNQGSLARGLGNVPSNRRLRAERRSLETETRPACGWSKLCRVAGLSEQQRRQLEEVIVIHDNVRRGQHLFEEGDPLQSLFVVRAGCVKGWVKTDPGQEQIVRFYLPGELLGLNAIGRGRHRLTATALGSACVLELPFDRLQSFADTTPDLNHRIYRMLSEEISSDEQTLSLLVNRTAEERVAGFLLDLSRRHGANDHPCLEFRLDMARHDIANYLGLARETVSLTITRFHNEGLLRVKGRRIEVLDAQRLVELGGLRAGSVFG